MHIAQAQLDWMRNIEKQTSYSCRLTNPPFFAATNEFGKCIMAWLPQPLPYFTGKLKF
jgi:hypothetical protein